MLQWQQTQTGMQRPAVAPTRTDGVLAAADAFAPRRLDAAVARPSWFT